VLTLALGIGGRDDGDAGPPDHLRRAIQKEQWGAQPRRHPGVDLPPKDQPILLAAIAAGATDLITGDRAHFGDYFGRRIAGVLIDRSGTYLAAKA
jgi:hypothetical protein